MHIVTDEQLSELQIDALGQVDCNVLYARNGSSDIHNVIETARQTLIRQAQEQKAHLIVFEPHIELPRTGENGMLLIMSARVYRYRGEI